MKIRSLLSRSVLAVTAVSLLALAAGCKTTVTVTGPPHGKDPKDYKGQPATNGPHPR